MKNLLLIMTCMLLIVEPANAQDKQTPVKEPETLGLNHIGLAVSKLDATVSFFIDTLGWKAAGGQPDYPARFVTNGKMFVTLWQVTSPDTAVPFNRKNNVGLHHLAITVRDLPTLHKLHRKFVARDDVSVEFAPEFLGDGPATHMMARDPSGLRIEFIVPTSRMAKEK